MSNYNFSDLVTRLQNHFNKITAAPKPLFVTDIPPYDLWDLYLDSFPKGTNETFRVRREFDCSCCRHFMKNMIALVWIDDDLNVHSIFEFDTGNDIFQPSINAIAREAVKGKIVSKYMSKTNSVGTMYNFEMMGTGSVKKWNHFYLDLPERYVFQGRGWNRDTIASFVNEFNTTRQVFRRSLEEITMEALDTVIELIESNTLYRGSEWLDQLKKFRKIKTQYDNLSEEKKDLFCWAKTDAVGPALGRIRNHSIGVLLVDISNGMDLDAAVRRYEKIVAPANYKRPKAIFTKKMIEDAEKTLTELGYIDSLPRRFATVDDITINDVLFVNRDTRKQIQKGSIFDEMKSEVDAINPKRFSRIDSIGIKDFIEKVLPSAREIEVLFESRLESNLVSLIAPQNREAESMFKWDNGFGWAYNGNIADSDIARNVALAGGDIHGVLRFSIQWNDGKDWDQNDLDAHCAIHGHTGMMFDHILFSHKHSRIGNGDLDVDIINPDQGKAAVENIVFKNKETMIPGDYEFFVNCYSNRGGKSGFRAEIEFDGKKYQYDYTRPLNWKENVKVATVTLDSNGNFSIKEMLPSTASVRETWGVHTNQFVPVSLITTSPNYWGEGRHSGLKHYFFMLKDCVNPDCPNGFFNEYLKEDLMEHKRVFEALGSRMKVAESPNQLSGFGFAESKRNEIIVKVKGATERVMKVAF